MEMLKNLKVPTKQVDARRHTQNPEAFGIMRGFLTPESDDNPMHVAERFLNANDASLGKVFSSGPAFAKAGSGQLVLERQIQTPAGYHVRFKQVHAGVPLVGAGASVHMTARRQVNVAINDLVQDVLPLDVETAKKAGLPESEAISKAVEAVDGRYRLRGRPDADLVIYRFDNRQYLVWRVSAGLKAVKPIETEADRAAAWIVFIDLKSGDVLDKMNILARVSGQAKVFCPSPVITLRDTNLAPGTLFPDYAYHYVTLSRLSGSGYLSGKYVTTRLTNSPRAFSNNHEFLFGSHDPGFEEVMSYYWIDRVCNYLHHLGFRQIFQTPVPVNARGTEEDQSWYDPSKIELNFGLGGINDAEDADIIMHEFGHALLDALVPGWGDSWYDAPVRAMGEGVGDFLACCFLSDVNGDFQPEVVGDWDAIWYSQSDPPALRRVDGTKTLENVVGRGISTALTSDTIKDTGANWFPEALKGLVITPNVKSRNPAYFEIAGNTVDTVHVNLPPGEVLTDHGKVGDLYAGEEHQDGEFWSAVLWDIYLALGGSSESDTDRLEASSKAIKLVLVAHKYLDDLDRETINYTDAAEALLDADRFAWGTPMDIGPNETSIKKVLMKRKLQL